MKITILFAAALAMDLAASVAHAGPPEVVLESKTLAVTVDSAFPRIESYQLKANGATLAGQTVSVSVIELNGKAEPCRVAFSKRGADVGEYRLSFGQAKIDVTMLLTVGEEAVDFRISEVKENGGTKLKSIAFPGAALLSVSSTEAGAELATVAASGYGNSKETMAPLASLPLMAKPDSGNYLFVSNGKLAAGIIGNHLEDVNRVAWHITGLDAVKTCTAWRPVWQYREVDSETLELPWAKIIVTADRNGDDKVDWQDAGLVCRKLMPRPFGSEFVRREVADQIAMDFASLSQQPFLRILDEIRKANLMTDGIGQRVTIKGFTAEGHDSANTDYGGHYNQRAGGLKDLTFLLENAGKYNTRVGVHINATEVYPEAHRYKREILDLDGNGNPKGGWAWLDQSHLIDKRKDTVTGNLYQSLDLMRRELPKLDFIYLDVYGESGWNGWKIASKINALGLPLGTEYSTALDPWTTWSHNKTLKGRIFRFLWNADRDIHDNDPLLRGSDHIGFMGWQGERDMQNFLRTTFGRNLPSKYLQHFDLLRWDAGKEADFSDGVKVVKSGETVTCTRDGRMVMTWTGGGSNNRLFVPWDPKSEAKIYVWDEVGTVQAWDLPPAWKGRSEVFLYHLTDLGRSMETRLPVANGRVTLKVGKSVPYVIYPERAPAGNPMVWGEGGLVADPGFDSHQLAAWKPQPADAKPDAVHIENMETGDSRLMIAGPSSVPTGVSQVIHGLEPGKNYSASAWVRIKGSRKAVIQVAPEGETKACHNYVSRTNVRNRNDSDAKVGTFFQRLRVAFTMPSGCTRANLQLLAAPDSSGQLVEFDDVRVVRTELAPESAKHVYFEDFENVDQGWGPFVYASQGQTQTHLSETNEGITTDTIQGKYSFKTLNEPAGMVVRSLPSFLRLKPLTRYRLRLDSITESELYHIVVQGRAGSSGTIRLDKALPKGKGSLNETFTTGSTEESFLAIVKSDKGGGMCVLDDITIDELGAAPAESLKEEDGDALPGARLSGEETFQKPLGMDWSTLVSKHEGTSLLVENGKLTIKAAANVSAMAERKLPAGTVAVEAALSAHGATGETWGPGMCLVWPGGQMLRVNLRGPENRFGIDSTAAPQKTAGSLLKDSEVSLRIRVHDDKLLVETRNEDEDGDWQSLAEFPRSGYPGDPVSVRLGKSHGVEGSDDHTAPGDAGVSEFSSLRVFVR
jgi:endo-alpha-N-acetylgalactosaminidase